MTPIIDLIPTVGDHLALDFLNTAPLAGSVEGLVDGACLRAWLAGVAIRPPGQVPLVPSDEDAEAARRFREWFRGFVAQNAGRPLDGTTQSQLGPLNALLAEHVWIQQIESVQTRGRTGLILSRHSVPTSGSAWAVQVTEAIIDLLCEQNFTRVKRCENPRCSLWFLDRSPTGKRRWCSMATCGNQAKVAAHRKRRA